MLSVCCLQCLSGHQGEEEVVEEDEEEEEESRGGRSESC